MKILVDSSVWIEYFSGGPKAKAVEKYFKPPHKIVLPSIVAYEVYKKINSERGVQMAVLLLAQMERLSHSVVPVDQNLAIQAADVSLQYKIPMADAMIYSTSLLSDAVIITMDAHLRDLPKVQFIT